MSVEGRLRDASAAALWGQLRARRTTTTRTPRGSYQKTRGTSTDSRLQSSRESAFRSFGSLWLGPKGRGHGNPVFEMWDQDGTRLFEPPPSFALELLHE